MLPKKLRWGDGDALTISLRLFTSLLIVRRKQVVGRCLSSRDGESDLGERAERSRYGSTAFNLLIYSMDGGDIDPELLRALREGGRARSIASYHDQHEPNYQLQPRVPQRGTLPHRWSDPIGNAQSYGIEVVSEERQIPYSSHSDSLFQPMFGSNTSSHSMPAIQNACFDIEPDPIRPESAPLQPIPLAYMEPRSGSMVVEHSEHQPHLSHQTSLHSIASSIGSRESFTLEQQQGYYPGSPEGHRQLPPTRQQHIESYTEMQQRHAFIPQQMSHSAHGTIDRMNPHMQALGVVDQTKPSHVPRVDFDRLLKIQQNLLRSEIQCPSSANQLAQPSLGNLSMEASLADKIGQLSRKEPARSRSFEVRKPSSFVPISPTTPPPAVVAHMTSVSPTTQRLKGLMGRSLSTQQALQEYDKQQGLPKSHSTTMVRTSRSRQQLLEERILPKWDGTPWIDDEGKAVNRRPRKKIKNNSSSDEGSV